LPILALVLFVSLDGDPATTFLPNGHFAGIEPLLEFAATMLSFVPLLAAVLLAMPILHGRSPQTLVAAGRIHWRALGYGLLGGFLIGVLISLVEMLLYPGRYHINPALVANDGVFRYAALILVSLALVPLQTSAEEFMFRGYLLQWIGLRLRNPLALSLISGLAFALPHLGNPEVRIDFWLVMLSYFLMGFFLAWVTLRWQGLEMALGVHAANNLFASLVVTYPDGALATPALFICDTLDPAYGLVSLVVAMGIYYLFNNRILKTGN